MKTSSALLLASLSLFGCSPIDPVVVPNQPESAGSETRADDQASLLPPPPSGTLRAPADTRTEEVDSTTGALPPQAE